MKSNFGANLPTKCRRLTGGQQTSKQLVHTLKNAAALTNNRSG